MINIVENLLGGVVGKIVLFVAGAALFAFIQPKLVELIDSIFIGLSMLGIEAENHLQLSNIALVIIVAAMFWLMKPPFDSKKKRGV